MARLNEKVLKERYTRDNKYFRIHEVFNPRINKPTMTGKFYSPYDMMDLSLADPEVLKKIADYKEGLPPDFFEAPVTENQVYGFFLKPLVPILRTDSRYYHPKIVNITKVNFTMAKKK